MSITEQFEMAWTPSRAGLLHALRREQTPDAPTADRLWAQECCNWHRDSLVQHSFIEVLRSRDPGMAQAFLTELEGFHFMPVPASHRSPVLYILFAALTAALGCAIALLLPRTYFLPRVLGVPLTVVFGTVLFGGLGGASARGIWVQTAESDRYRLASLYAAQLQILHDRLLALLQSL